VSKPHLVQYLCGPQHRHTLIGFLFVPGQLAPEVAAQTIQEEMEQGICDGLYKQECPLCGSPRSEWIVEEEVLDCETIDDGDLYVAKLIVEQRFEWRTRN
jgi:hypothetical protein